jgi:centrosomal protein CEP110
MQSKLSRLPAMVKGYLVRRLVKTEKVQDTIKTIRDTTQELINLNLELPEREVTQEDVSLHSRLIAQLESACRRYYDIFMNCSKKEQMNMIANSRNFMMERQFRSNSKPSTPSLSSVSKRTLERKVTDSKVRKSSSSSSAAAVSSARRNDKMR